MRAPYVFKLKQVIKDAILFILNASNGPKKVSELKKLLGIKKQSLYNYLNELEDEGKLASELRPATPETHFLSKYYAIPKKNTLASHPQEPHLPEFLPPQTPPRKSCLTKERPKPSQIRMAERAINMTIAPLLVMKQQLHLCNPGEFKRLYSKLIPRGAPNNLTGALNLYTTVISQIVPLIESDQPEK